MQAWCLAHPSDQVAVSVIKPAESVNVSVVFTAPSAPCTVMSEWKLADENGFIDIQGEGTLRCIVRVVSV